MPLQKSASSSMFSSRLAVLATMARTLMVSSWGASDVSRATTPGTGLARRSRRVTRNLSTTSAARSGIEVPRVPIHLAARAGNIAAHSELNTRRLTTKRHTKKCAAGSEPMWKVSYTRRVSVWKC